MHHSSPEPAVGRCVMWQWVTFFGQFTWYSDPEASRTWRFRNMTIIVIIMPPKGALSEAGITHHSTSLIPMSRNDPGCLPRWLRWVRQSAHRPGRSIGGARFNSRVGRLISCSDSMGACFEINFLRRQEGLTVFSIICDRWLILS